MAATKLSKVLLPGVLLSFTQAQISAELATHSVLDVHNKEIVQSYRCWAEVMQVVKSQAGGLRTGSDKTG